MRKFSLYAVFGLCMLVSVATNVCYMNVLPVDVLWSVLTMERQSSSKAKPAPEPHYHTSMSYQVVNLPSVSERDHHVIDLDSGIEAWKKVFELAPQVPRNATRTLCVQEGQVAPIYLVFHTQEKSVIVELDVEWGFIPREDGRMAMK